MSNWVGIVMLKQRKRITDHTPSNGSDRPVGLAAISGSIARVRFTVGSRAERMTGKARRFGAAGPEDAEPSG